MTSVERENVLKREYVEDHKGRKGGDLKGTDLLYIDDLKIFPTSVS